VDIDRFWIQIWIYQTADSNRKQDRLRPETEVVIYMLSSIDIVVANFESDLNFSSCVVKRKDTISVKILAFVEM
jgi:hypothetical protein